LTLMKVLSVPIKIDPQSQPPLLAKGAEFPDLVHRKSRSPREAALP